MVTLRRSMLGSFPCKMKTETKAKIKAAKEAKSQSLAAQTIHIKPGWSIKRIDDFNWSIRWPGQARPYYYVSLEAALRDLPHRVLDQEAKSSLEQVYGVLLRLQETISKLVLPLKELKSSILTSSK